jgi:RNA polymerase sigma-B factor
LSPSETTLFERYQHSGDQSAREELTERFLPLARALSRRYRSASEPYEDLFQVACLGLVKAIDRFDPRHGASFHAYAVPTILGELKRHFRDRVMPLHMPRSVKEWALDVGDATEALTGELERPPTVAEVAERTELSEDQVIDALGAIRASRTVSLDVPMGGEDGESPPAVEAVGGDDPKLELIESKVAVDAAMEVLDERERHCIELRFGRDLTQEEIAVEVGVSQVHVSRILRAALDKLRHSPAALGRELVA